MKAIDQFMCSCLVSDFLAELVDVSYGFEVGMLFFESAVNEGWRGSMRNINLLDKNANICSYLIELDLMCLCYFQSNKNIL